MVTGKQRSRNVSYNEATLSFTGSGGATMKLVVRAGAEGVAYRYVIPNAGSITVSSEASSWKVPTSAPAWLNVYASDYQGNWSSTTAGGAPGGEYAYPALFQVGGTYVNIAESDVDGRYGSSVLNHSAGSGTYTTSLESSETTTGPLSTPWRIAAVGDLNTVTTTRIVDDMAPPSRISDTSWIKPGAVAWSWLTEGVASVTQQERYIDFAQKHGWSAILVDDGFQDSWIPELVSYGRARGVGIIVWYDSSDLQTQAQRDTILNKVKNWGAVGVKIDYVFEHNQATMKWFDTILAQTASLKLMVNFHGTEMTRGMQRTWPHVMTSEAVFGAEQKQNNAAFDTILPYTRNMVSSMDFTPVDFSVGGRNTTNGHELGMSVAFESGWQHFSDNPGGYESQPLAVAILDKLPTVWDESRLLGGAPGKEVYLARRYGDKWYAGGLSAVAAKTFSASLSFLGSGQYFVETVHDGSSGGLIRDTKVVTSADTLSVSEATNGGFVSVICPYTAGTTTCGKPGSTNPPPATNLALNHPTKASASCNANETSDKAVNGSVSGGNSDKWCSGVAGTKTIEVDLGTNHSITSVVVKHAGSGGESTSYNTVNFLIETSTGGGVWSTAATVSNNTASSTTTAISATARWVRLSISDPVARIYEFEVY
jgi:hypothetical protein